MINNRIILLFICLLYFTKETIRKRRKKERTKMNRKTDQQRVQFSYFQIILWRGSLAVLSYSSCLVQGASVTFWRRIQYYGTEGC